MTDTHRRTRIRAYPPDAICTVEGCSDTPKSRGLCNRHYLRVKSWGNPTIRPDHRRRRLRSRGHTWLTPTGYALTYEPNHPNAPKSGAVMEHVVVMTGVLQRPLVPGETVHHKNGVRNDNRPENLALRVTAAHLQGLSPEEAVAWAREILARYG